MKSVEDVDNFLMLLMQLDKSLQDFLELSKKKPNDPVNKFKLRLVNTLFERANSFLDKSYKPFDSFETFDEDEIPTNSDVVLILSQYLGCLKKYGRDNTHDDGFKDLWIIKGKVSTIDADMNKLRD